MLSDKSRPVIEATLPIIGERISHITPKFYDRMFAARPELLDGLFSRANQKNGAQQQALAGSIAAFATHLVNNPGTLPEAVLSRIAHKHTSLGIVEEQYAIVYEHLFAAIVDDLGEAVTPEVAEAWSEVYWLMADALVKIEKGLYAQQANDKIWTDWKLVAKEAAGTGSVTFRFVPADDTPVTVAKAGQFVSVRVPLLDGLRQCRQYTLSDSVTSTTERVITTKFDGGGEVSPFMHQHLNVGDVIELSNPYGDLVIDTTGAPIILATAGIGCTPSASALATLAAAGSDRQVMVLHAEANEDAWALKEQMLESVDSLPNAELKLWLEDINAKAEGTEATEGYMSLANLELPADARLYLCGPLPFMRAVRSQAIEAGIPATNIHYEVFGPDLWLAA
ncbi:globin domain-containing protein [Paeniglutamicibacter psychrophenolicus]|jgi:nitric oxide dioxygenase|uniref:globin domain-containing protein n=1 Tax=Paeniglutamicibacter psychrophenolicus TaxID=257454 RepID=UPI0027813E96|nr:globin domain-containing protein [Paeniglutamicibacter psychrophenolicus]MDQ0095659.1 nitric oxide dioxygenase [Paeniglutamicibacter psychrophenolicus]